FQRAIDALVARHESLRTTFRTTGDQHEQVAHAPSAVKLQVIDAESEGAAIAALRAVANTPFDLASEPGFRVAVARLGADDHIVLLLTHHIVSDAWSYGVMFRDLNALYAGKAAAPVDLQLGDYAAWQRSTLHGAALDEALGYWRERLADLPVLDLPTV